jgi:hypothetical protein
MKKKSNNRHGGNVAVQSLKAVNKSSNSNDTTKGDDWISNLAKLSSSENGNEYKSSKSACSRLLSKQERIEHRAAKKRRREERKGVTTTNVSRERTGSSMEQQNEEQKQQPKQKGKKRPPHDKPIDSFNPNVAMHTQICMNKLSNRLQESIDRLYEGKSLQERKYDKPFTTPMEKGKAKAGHKLSDSIIQPRKNDYGGLGLARPSLLLDLRDVSFVPKLEEEFAEHIPGFFGKQRTKAMKKQLDGNMLWRRLSSGKVRGDYGDKMKNAKVDGKKLSEMTPDERVEAMIKLNMI